MARNTGRVATNYDQLFAGEVWGEVNITIGNSQTIRRGDLLECIVTETVDPTTHALTRAIAATWGLTATDAKPVNFYCIAADSVTTESNTTAVIAAYKGGYFNISKVRLGATPTGADLEKTKNALIGQEIFLKTASTGVVTA